jgi:TPR repeat protein
VNKKAALLESNSDERGAFLIYEECYNRGKANALLLFNLGWCLVNGEGVDKKDVERGEKLWRKAVDMAPDEGSEEAAWFLYEQYRRNDPKEAEQWLDLAVNLGYDDAVIEKGSTQSW